MKATTKKAAGLLFASALVCSLCTAPAFAAIEKDGTSEVVVSKADPGQISVTIPQQIPLAAGEDGTFMAPTAQSSKLVNNSAFAVHVSKVTATPIVIAQTPVATQNNVLLTITPTPDPAAQAGQVADDPDALDASATAAQTVTDPAAQTAADVTGQSAETVVQDPNAKGSKTNPYRAGETFTFQTEVLASGQARISSADTEYDTLNIAMTLDNYLTPEYYEENHADKYRLKGTETGAQITFTILNSTSTDAVMPQDALEIVFENEAGLEISGYNITDAEIAGEDGVTVQPGQTITAYKRFIYNEAENMSYMVVKYYQGGVEYKAYFKLEVVEPEVVYTQIGDGSRGDDVQKLQERLIELGYLDDDADGIFGQNTQNAITAAQQQAGMSETGVADDAFQKYIYSDEAQPASAAG